MLEILKPQMVIHYKDKSVWSIEATEFEIFEEFYVFKRSGKNVALIERKNVTHIMRFS